jgi:hypothetical protein
MKAEKSRAANRNDECPYKNILCLCLKAEGSLCHQDSSKSQAVPVHALKAFRVSGDVAAFIINRPAGDE